MPNVTCELGDVVEMTNLAWSVLVGICGECECQRFVVCKNIELTTFDEVAKVPDGKVHCKELSVKCAVPGFWRTELSGEIGVWMPPVTNTLLQDSSNCTIGSIGHNACGLGWTRRVAVARASLMATKAAVDLPSQTSSCLPFFGGDSIEFSGTSTAAQLGMKR